MNIFFTQNATWYEKIGKIYALLERVKISEEQSADILHLRRTSRILSIGSTTAIEGNRFSPSQVKDVINGKPVWGPPKDIKEVQNAYSAYELIPQLNPYTYNNQQRYYEALQHSHNNAGKVDCAPFIDFMLEVIENTMFKYYERITLER